MKQDTTPEQTAKLIELGFAPQTRIKGVSTKYGIVNIEHETYFDVGSLIEILGYDLYSIHYKGLAWEVKSERVETREAELIDALYNMILKLKEEEII